MKKKFFPVALMALAIGFNACSSDDVTVNANGGVSSPAIEGGYAKVSINLPSRSNSNRANDKFDDGLASEYHVNNAKLVLFQGSKEGDATFHSAYDLLKVGMDGYNEVDPNPNQITTTTRIISRLDDKTPGTGYKGNNLYALVVLNDNGLLNITNDGKSLTVDGKDMVGNGLAFLQKLAVSSSDFKSKGLLMTNAPLAKEQGGTHLPGGDVVTLVDFTKSVYNTEAEAQKNTATDVYVERAVAKVTMDQSSGDKLVLKSEEGGTTTSSDVHFIGNDGKSNGQDIKWEIVGWDLDVTNNSSYLVRNTTNTHAAEGDAPWNGLKSEKVDNYRFVGSNAVKTGSSLYRTYWAEDPNYNSFDANFTYLPLNKTDFTKEFGLDNPKYCFENTFDVDHQVKKGTTRVIVKVKLKDGNNSAETFYTFNGDNSSLYKQTEAETRIKQTILHELKSKPVSASKPDFSSLTEAKIEDVTLGDYDATTGTVKVTKFKAEGKVAVTTGGVTTTMDKMITFEGASPELSEVNTALKTIMYKDGCAYYPIRIKHFGKDDTPWNEETNAPTKTTAKPSKGATTTLIYPGKDIKERSNNYLGRYGVLRNNWYDISVSKISAIGSPVVPKTDETPDDDFYNYIAVRINVLSWAKRTQVEEL